MAISYVQNKSGQGPSGTGLRVDLSLLPQNGNLLVATIAMLVGASVATVTSIASSARWIQVGASYCSTGGCEIWACRGCPSTAGDTIVTFTGSAASVEVNVAEFSGVGIVPVDTWSQNAGSSASATATTINPRQNGDLVISAAAYAAGLTSVPSGYTSLGQNGAAGGGSAFLVNSGSVSATPLWTLSASIPWATTTAAFLAGGPQNPASTPNANLQFPEVQVQISPQNWMTPLMGNATWIDITSYVQSMTLGPIGRQHELDRVQAAPAQFVMDNRSGVFNPWNTQSFLYPSCLDPMSPVKVTAAWNGITYPVYYGYFQSLTNTINDVLDVDAQMDCVDIFQILSLKYLTSNAYASLVESDGGANLVAYYRCGDALGSYSIADSSGNGYTGSLFDGPGGTPAFNTPGAFLYDADTALDLTNATNSPNGGFQMVNHLTEPPVVNNPLSNAHSWTFECWAKWTQSSPPAASVAAAASGNSSSVAAVPNGILFHASASVVPGIGNYTVELQAGYSGAIAPSASNALFLATTDGSIPVASRGTPSNADIFDGNYHHLAAVGAPTVTTYYVDGVQASQTNFGGATGAVLLSGITVGSPPQSASNIALPGQTSDGWAGTIDEVAIYSIALTATQIANHYAQGQWFQSIEVGAATGGTSTNRTAKVLSISGIPTGILYVPYPFRTYLYAETNPVTTTSGLNYIQTTTETEPGIIFQGPDGYIHAYNRQYQYLNPTTTTSQGIFGDNTSVASYHYEGTSFTVGQDDLDLFNDIQVQSGRGGFQLSAVRTGTGATQSSTEAPFTVGGGQLEEWSGSQSATLASSASVYGQRTMQGLTSLQQEYDSDALAMAQFFAAIYATPIPRVQQMTVNSYANGGNNIPPMLGLGIFDRITIQYQGQSPGPQFSQDSIIEGVQHTITMKDGPTWKTVFNTSAYELLLSPLYLGTWRFGDTTGVLTL